MADLPTVDQQPKKTRVMKVKIETVSIELPMGPPSGYVRRRVDLGRMTAKQAEALSELTSGLQHKEAKLLDGAKVRTELHAIKWLLENLK